LSHYARDYAPAGGPPRLPVICLHGLTRNSRDFEDVAPWIARTGRRVLAPDIRGRGLSGWDEQAEQYTPVTYARDVLELMDRLEIAGAVFLGTSMGGIITMALPQLRADAIAGAILNDIGPIVAFEGIQRIKGYTGRTPAVSNWEDASAYVRETNGVAFPDNSRGDWERFARRVFREYDGVPKLDYDPRIAEQLRNDQYKQPDDRAWAAFRELAQSCPTLVIRGELSDLLSGEIAEQMKAAAPSIQLVEVPRVGHAPMLTEPEAAEAIASFLAQLP
jgi:pimeloyl-ACP methyl ester carboxylesterase